MLSADIPYSSDNFKFDFSLTELLLRAKSTTRASWKDIHKFIPLTNFSNAIVTDSQMLFDKWRRLSSNKITDIIYIGKGNVRKRIRSLVRFRIWKADTHVGGEWLWQICGYENLKILISSCPQGKEAAYERFLLNKFKTQHNDWPLANRMGGTGQDLWFPK